MCPVPPNNLPTGRVKPVLTTANMVLSCVEAREHLSRRGNLGFPVRDVPACEGGYGSGAREVHPRSRSVREPRPYRPPRDGQSSARLVMRQVTTATPASWTSARQAGAEGCVGAMPTEAGSVCPMVDRCSRARSALAQATTRNPRRFGGVCVWKLKWQSECTSVSLVAAQSATPTSGTSREIG